MKINIDTQFNIGDEIWHKNLVTNESYKDKVKAIMFTQSTFVNDGGEIKTSSIVIYHTESGDMCTNTEGNLGANSAYATKEECDAVPAFDPRQNPYLN